MNSDLLRQLNFRAWHLCDHLRDHANDLDIIEHQTAGATVFDFGVNRCGTMSGGIALAMICLADLGDVQLQTDPTSNLGLPTIQITTDHPLAACVAAQYAGWPFMHDGFFAMCSGPARMARGEEELLEQYELTGTSEFAVGIFEANELPTEAATRFFAESCHVEPEVVTICIARTASLPGTIQVVARSVETTMHKLHELKFDLRSVKNATGIAPLPPIAAQDLQSLGWTNDAILYGSHVNLWIDADDSEIESIGPQIPSSSSSIHGKPFLEIFDAFDRDFYKIDKMLFSPASVVINSLQSGRTFRFGEIREDIMRSSFQI